MSWVCAAGLDSRAVRWRWGTKGMVGMRKPGMRPCACTHVQV